MTYYICTIEGNKTIDDDVRWVVEALHVEKGGLDALARCRKWAEGYIGPISCGAGMFCGKTYTRKAELYRDYYITQIEL